MDRYSRRLGQSSSSLGNNRDIRHPSFCRRPSPLIGSCHQHSRSLPRCTAGARPLGECSQTRSTCSNHSHQVSRTELHDSDLQLSVTDSEDSRRSDQHSEQIQFDDSEFAQELIEHSRNSSSTDVCFDEDPPPYPGTETQSFCGSVTQLEGPVTALSSSSVLHQAVENVDMVSHDHSEASEGHSSDQAIVDNVQTLESVDETCILPEGSPSRERAETSCSEHSVSSQEEEPSMESPLTENLQLNQHNIEDSSTKQLDKDCAHIHSAAGHEKETNSLDLSSSSVLHQAVENVDMVSHDHSEASEGHSSDQAIVDNVQTLESVDETCILPEGSPSRERAETSCSEHSVSSQEEEPSMESPLTENLQLNQHNIEDSSTKQLDKDCAHIHSAAGHEKETNSLESPWQRRLSLGRRRGRARGREDSQKPGSLAGAGYHTAKHNPEETEENPLLGRDTIIS